MKTLRIILWDHLSHDVSSLSDLDMQTDTILMCETVDDCTYVKHHKKKLVFLLSAMRHFAKELIDKGCNVIYTKLDDPLNAGNIAAEIKRRCTDTPFDQIVVTWPGNYRHIEILEKLRNEMSIPIIIREDKRFLSSLDEFKRWASNRKELRMEYFYREIRIKYNILMDNGQPCGGKWNFDSENRKVPKEKLEIPQTYSSTPDAITEDVIKIVSQEFDNHFGDIQPFHFAVTSEEAQQAFNLFIKERLSDFGDFQDAMIEHEPWMYHSHISFYVNVGLLDPFYCIKSVEQAGVAIDLCIKT